MRLENLKKTTAGTGKKATIGTTNKTSTKTTKKEEETPKVEKREKKHTLLKGILILIIIALVLLLIHFARNYVIVDSILAKQEALKELTNYSYKMNYDYSDTTMEYYHKENNVMLIRNSETGKVIIWSSKDTNETIFLNPRELTAIVDKKDMGDFVFYNVLPRGLILNSEGARGFDIMYFITSETIDGIDCYKVQLILGEETSWYNKKDGTMVKTVQGNYETKYADWKFNQLTDEDMSRPNLMGYEVTRKGESSEEQQNTNNNQNDNNGNQINQENSENQVDKENQINVNELSE